MDSHAVNMALLQAEDHFRKAKTASTPEIARVHQELGDQHLATAVDLHTVLKQQVQESKAQQ